MGLKFQVVDLKIQFSFRFCCLYRFSSVKESICAKTPLIVMPLFAEQAHNARFVLETGIGSTINKFKLSKKLVLSTFLEVRLRKGRKLFSEKVYILRL